MKIRGIMSVLTRQKKTPLDQSERKGEKIIKYTISLFEKYYRDYF